MPDNPTIQLNVQATDNGTLSEQQRRVVDLTRAIEALKTEYKNGYYTAEQYKAGLKSLTAEKKAATQQLAAMGGATSTAAVGTKNYTMAVLSLGYALEDMQYGLAYGLNNLTMVAMALQAPAGVIIGTQLAAAGALALIRNWDNLGISGKTLKTSIQEAREELEKFNKAAAHSAQDVGGARGARLAIAANEGGARVMGQFGTAPVNEGEATAFAGAIKQLPEAAIAEAERRVREQAESNPELQRQATHLESRSGGVGSGYSSYVVNQDELTALRKQASEAAAQGLRALADRAAKGDADAIAEMDKLLGGQLSPLMAGERERLRAGQFVGPPEDPIRREERLKDRQLTEALNEQGRANERIAMEDLANQRLRQKEERERVQRGMMARGYAQTQAADAALAPLVEGSGAVGMLAEAANELMLTPWGGRRGQMTAAQKRRAMLNYMRKGMSRKDALARVNEDEQAAMQTAGYDALATAQGQLANVLMAQGMSPDDARRAARLASQGVLGNTPEKAQEDNTNALGTLTTAVNTLRTEGIPLRLARRGRR